MTGINVHLWPPSQPLKLITVYTAKLQTLRMNYKWEHLKWLIPDDKELQSLTESIKCINYIWCKIQRISLLLCKTILNCNGDLGNDMCGLHCIVMYCIVLYCIVVLSCIAAHCHRVLTHFQLTLTKKYLQGKDRYFGFSL